MIDSDALKTSRVRCGCGTFNGAALTAGFGFGVISFSETVALASGETYRLTALQTNVPQMDITGGEVVIERLG